MTRAPDEQMLAFLAVRDRPVGDLALALRDKVLEAAPDAVERVFRNHPAALWFGCGPKMQDMFCYVAMASRHVNLGFCRGATLPDPDGVFEGAGKAMRHVKFRSHEELSRPFVIPYIQAARAQLG
jgi:hypothetical protein